MSLFKIPYFFFVLSYGALIARFYQISQSISRSITLSISVDASISEMSSLTLSNHVWRCFLVGFLFRTFCNRLSSARPNVARTIFLLLGTILYLARFTTFLDHRFFVSYNPHFDFEQIREFSAKLFLRK